jgi:regulatory protein
MAQEPVVDPRRPSKTRKNSSRADAPGGAAQPSLRERALRLLGRREFSRQELDKRLSAYAENPEELAALLDDLSERGWLSDARYAEALVRKRAGQYARRSIAQELKQAGISADVTDAALAEVNPDEEFAAALALCLRKFRHAPVDQKEKARQIRFLQARGYSLNLALRVLKHGRAGEDSGD